MKKIHCFIAVFVLAWSVHAQTLIPKAGVTLNGVAAKSDYYSNSQDIKVGFMVGAAFEIPVAGIFSIQPEVNFVRKGYNLEQTHGDGSFKYTYTSKNTLNYLEVPVLAKVTLGSAKKFYLIVGPSLGRGLRGKYSSTSKYYSIEPTGWDIVQEHSEGDVKFGDTPSNPPSNTHYFKSLDLSLQAGAGVNIAGKIIVELRYIMGFTNLINDDFPLELKNRTLAITAAVPIHFK